jgi:hypothetical protein
MGGLSEPRREAPPFFRRLVDKADRWIDIYDVHQYPIATTEAGLRDDFAAQVDAWRWLAAYPAAAKIRWMTETGGPKSDGDTTAEDFDDHDFLLAKSWLKIYLWYAESTHKPRSPERIFWFRLTDKPSLPRRTNKYNGFLYASAAWREEKPQSFSRKQFFIDSVRFWLTEIGDFRKVEALCSPKDDVQIFRVTRGNGSTVWVAWNEGTGSATVAKTALGPVTRIRQAMVARPAFRATFFQVVDTGSLRLPSETLPRSGTILLIN